VSAGGSKIPLLTLWDVLKLGGVLPDWCLWCRLRCDSEEPGTHTATAAKRQSHTIPSSDDAWSVLQRAGYARTGGKLACLFDPRNPGEMYSLKSEVLYGYENW